MCGGGGARSHEVPLAHFSFRKCVPPSTSPNPQLRAHRPYKLVKDLHPKSPHLFPFAPLIFQIRNYVLHPYKLVKDLRTGLESSDPTAVLAGGGELDAFVDAFLRHRAAGAGAAGAAEGAAAAV